MMGEGEHLISAAPPAAYESQLTTPAATTITTAISRSVGSGDDEDSHPKKYQGKFPFEFPPGFRFNPQDDELIVHYLNKKVQNRPLPYNNINDVNLYLYNPEQLVEMYKDCGEKDWYFFTPRDRKYRNGSRPNRAAGDGYWKATGADKHIKKNNQLIGYRKALVFYRGKPTKVSSVKTNWIMHEYRVKENPDKRLPRSDGSMRLDDWVLCRIHRKPEKTERSPKAQRKGDESSDLDDLELGDNEPDSAGRFYDDDDNDQDQVSDNQVGVFNTTPADCGVDDWSSFLPDFGDDMLASFDSYNNNLALDSYNNDLALDSYNNNLALDSYNNSLALDSYNNSLALDSYNCYLTSDPSMYASPTYQTHWKMNYDLPSQIDIYNKSVSKRLHDEDFVYLQPNSDALQPSYAKRLC